MPNERDSYIRVKLSCQTCFSLVYCRVLARRESATLMVTCPQCKNDIVAAVIPDEKMDNNHNEKDLWIVPLYDLIMLEDRMTEVEGDRMVWGLKSVFENAIHLHCEKEGKCL